MPRSALACSDLPLDKVPAEYTKAYRRAGFTAWCSGRLFRRVDVRPYIRCLEIRLGLAGPPVQVWEFRIIDCQQASPHVMRFGAEEIPRRDFLNHLTVAFAMTERLGCWGFDLS